MTAAYYTVALAGTLAGLLGLAGALLGGLLGLLAGAAIALLLVAVSFFAADGFLLRRLGATPLEDPALNELAAGVALNARIPVPRLYSIDSPAPNAFLVGSSPTRAAIAVTTGLLGSLTTDELEGVFAYHIAHVRNRTARSRTMAAFVSWPVSAAAQRAHGHFRRREPGRGSRAVSGLFTALFAILAALLTRMAVHRLHVFQADYNAALIMRNPDALASALQKVMHAPPAPGGNASAPLWFAHPFGRAWHADLSITHPLTERRIERLRQLGEA